MSDRQELISDAWAKVLRVLGDPETVEWRDPEPVPGPDALAREEYEAKMREVLEG